MQCVALVEWSDGDEDGWRLFMGGDVTDAGGGGGGGGGGGNEGGVMVMVVD